MTNAEHLASYVLVAAENIRQTGYLTRVQATELAQRGFAALHDFDQHNGMSEHAWSANVMDVVQAPEG